MASATVGGEILIERSYIGAHWQVPADVILIWKSWDEGHEVVFNAASGQIHLLDPLSATALREVAAAAATVSEITDRLAQRYELDRATVAERVATACAEFDRLGLAERALS
ncbi:MAG: HPr-rel-A system PqqD family peptide chaperone [Alphaproteobacteria bacterium]